MIQETPIGSVWHNPMWDAEMTVEGVSGPENEYIQVSYDGSDVVEDEFKRTNWKFERVE